MSWTATFGTTKISDAPGAFIEVEILFNSSEEKTPFSKTYKIPFGIENPLAEVIKRVKGEIQVYDKFHATLAKLVALQGQDIETSLLK